MGLFITSFSRLVSYVQGSSCCSNLILGSPFHSSRGTRASGNMYKNVYGRNFHNSKKKERKKRKRKKKTEVPWLLVHQQGRGNHTTTEECSSTTPVTLKGIP